MPRTAFYFKSHHVQQVFQQQVSILDKPILALGIQPQNDLGEVMQCGIGDKASTWTNQAGCDDSEDYQWSNSVGLPADFTNQANQLDALLSANGWINDSPQSVRLTLKDISTASLNNGGTAVGVPYHKNIGAISCNLEIDFGTPDGFPTPLTPNSGALNINRFTCSENFSVPELHM